MKDEECKRTHSSPFCILWMIQKFSEDWTDGGRQHRTEMLTSAAENQNKKKAVREREQRSEQLEQSIASH